MTTNKKYRYINQLVLTKRTQPRVEPKHDANVTAQRRHFDSN